MLHTERHNGAANIQWGKVVAGAAVATGAIILGVAVAQGEVPIISEVVQAVTDVVKSVFTGLGEGISATFHAAPQAGADAAKGGIFQGISELMSHVGEYLKNNASSIGGTTLLAGGLGYLTMHYENAQTQAQPAMALADARLKNAEMGFAAREQMRAVNALMQARMQAFGQTSGQER